MTGRRRVPTEPHQSPAARPGLLVQLTCIAAAVSIATLVTSARGPSIPRRDEVGEQRRRAFALAYNLDYQQAFETLDAALADHPNDASLHRSIAAVTWALMLFQRGIVTVDHFSGGIGSKLDIPKPAADLDQRFRTGSERAIAISEARLRQAPADVNAHYELGAAVGLRVLYVATVEGSTMGAIRAARRAFDEHERVLELDASRKDAGLIVGSYRYAISLLSAPMRLMAYIVGFGGGRELGLRMIEEAAAYPSDAQPEALFGLLLLYNRERRFADALRAVVQLQDRYPRNRLLLLEEASTALRAGELARAAQALDRGFTALDAETRPLAGGERTIWHAVRGATRLRLGRTGEATQDLRIAEQDASSPNWLKGRIQLGLGKSADLGGDRKAAVTRYERATLFCEAGRDQSCADEAKRLNKSVYKGGD